VTHYEKVTREEIARRNYTEGTTRAYLRALHDLASYFQQPPEHLTPGQIREYTAHLISERKLSGNTVNQMVGALRFFYLTVLNKPWRGHEMPYPKKSMHLPVIWSPDEVARLIDAAPTRFYRTIIMTLYATGMRRAEVAALKVCDVDSARMVLHVQEGKGRKDRDVVLSPICWRSCGSIIAVWAGNRRSGFSPAARITPPRRRSPRKSSGTPAAGRRSAAA